MLRISWTDISSDFLYHAIVYVPLNGLPVFPVLKVYLWACNLGSPKIGALEAKIHNSYSGYDYF